MKAKPVSALSDSITFVLHKSCCLTANGTRRRVPTYGPRNVSRSLSRNGSPAILGAGFALGVVLLLAGCDGGKAPATQLAAKVNGNEISIHQINQALVTSGSPTGTLTPERLAALRGQILDKLIDQQLAVDQAIESKLDRKPDVVMQLESTKRQILARSYYAQVVTGLPQPTTEEARKYYSEHPQLFARRRIYKLQEVIVPGKEITGDNLRVLASSLPLGDVITWLKSRKVNFATNTGVRAAEQIPMDVLEQLEQFKDGQAGVIETPRTLLLVQLVSAQAAPLTEAAAMPVIMKYLQNKQVLDAIERDTARQRSRAKIEYLNEFAQHAPGRAADPGAATPSVPAAEDILKGTSASGSSANGSSAIGSAAGSSSSGNSSNGNSSISTLEGRGRQ